MEAPKPFIATGIEIEKYVIEVPFKISDYLLKYKTQLLNLYNQKLSESPHRTFSDFPVPDTEFQQYLNYKLHKLVKKYFHVGPLLGIYPINVYIQNNSSGFHFWHHHAKHEGSVQGVFYLDIPKEGGEIKFAGAYGDRELKIKPKQDMVYFFPNWLLHTPTPQTDSSLRICFNYRHASNVRPVVKLTNVIW